MSKLRKKLTAKDYATLPKELRVYYVEQDDCYVLQTDEQELLIVNDLEINNPEIVLENPSREDDRIGFERIESLLSIFQGPLPPPEQLAEYNKAFPDAAEKIFDLTKSEADHRRGLERWETKGDVIRSFVGVVAGLGISLFLLYIAWDLASAGYPLLAGLLAIFNLTALVTVFIYGTLPSRQTRDKDSEKPSEKELKKMDEDDGE